MPGTTRERALYPRQPIKFVVAFKTIKDTKYIVLVILSCIYPFEQLRLCSVPEKKGAGDYVAAATQSIQPFATRINAARAQQITRHGLDRGEPLHYARSAAALSTRTSSGC